MQQQAQRLNPKNLQINIPASPREGAPESNQKGEIASVKPVENEKQGSKLGVAPHSTTNAN